MSGCRAALGALDVQMDLSNGKLRAGVPLRRSDERGDGAAAPAHPVPRQLSEDLPSVIYP